MIDDFSANGPPMQIMPELPPSKPNPAQSPVVKRGSDAGISAFLVLFAELVKGTPANEEIDSVDVNLVETELKETSSDGDSLLDDEALILLGLPRPMTDRALPEKKETEGEVAAIATISIDNGNGLGFESEKASKEPPASGGTLARTDSLARIVDLSETDAVHHERRANAPRATMVHSGSLSATLNTALTLPDSSKSDSDSTVVRTVPQELHGKAIAGNEGQDKLEVSTAPSPLPSNFQYNQVMTGTGASNSSFTCVTQTISTSVPDASRTPIGVEPISTESLIGLTSTSSSEVPRTEPDLNKGQIPPGVIAIPMTASKAKSDSDRNVGGGEDQLDGKAAVHAPAQDENREYTIGDQRSAPAQPAFAALQHPKSKSASSTPEQILTPIDLTEDEHSPFNPTSTTEARSIGAISGSTVVRDGGALAQAVAGQIASSISLRPSGTTEITLSPAELGRVRLSMTAADGVMTVSIFAERPETTDLMRRNIEILAQECRNLGFEDLTFRFADRGNRQGQQDGTGTSSQSAELKPEPMLQVERAQRNIAGRLDLRL